MGTAVGTDSGVDASVQAEFVGTCEQSEPTNSDIMDAAGALARLPPGDKAQVENFLRVLSVTGGAADASTVEALLKLMRSLPPPEGPRALLGVLKIEQPALFARLHESMLRTHQRQARGDGPRKASTGKTTATKAPECEPPS